MSVLKTWYWCWFFISFSIGNSFILNLVHFGEFFLGGRWASSRNYLEELRLSWPPYFRLWCIFEYFNIQITYVGINLKLNFQLAGKFAVSHIKMNQKLSCMLQNLTGSWKIKLSHRCCENIQKLDFFLDLCQKIITNIWASAVRPYTSIVLLVSLPSFLQWNFLKNRKYHFLNSAALFNIRTRWRNQKFYEGGLSLKFIIQNENSHIPTKISSYHWHFIF